MKQNIRNNFGEPLPLHLSLLLIGGQLWWCTHPIEAAQVLHQMFICGQVVVDDSVLFVHTARLRHRHTTQPLSLPFISFLLRAADISSCNIWKSHRYWCSGHTGLLSCRNQPHTQEPTSPVAWARSPLDQQRSSLGVGGVESPSCSPGTMMSHSSSQAGWETPEHPGKWRQVETDDAGCSSVQCRLLCATMTVLIDFF